MSTPNPKPTLTVAIPGTVEPSIRIEVNLLASAELANLASIFGDLLISTMSASQAKDPVIAGPGFIYVRRACWEAAITSYSRCFERGQGVDRNTRTHLGDFVQNLTPELRDCHDQVRLLRGRRIGHHVALESGPKVSFYFGGERPRPDELQITEFFVRVETELYDSDLLDRLEELTTLLRDRVGKRIDELRFEIVNKASGNLQSVRDADRLGQPWMPV
jgi:hypothetical protein